MRNKDFEKYVDDEIEIFNQEMDFKDKINILKKMCPTEEQEKKYIEKNWIDNKIEQLIINNAMEKQTLVSSHVSYYEKINNKNEWLGSKSNFALNWKK